ncbi:hypothetical protein K461DRAFT_310114 [Myriangium duriaei CBS 260.36]|uniref:DUF2231 domain-containing protein n=1 Tax=Myriangium duriaei CBS 260.36 TaxID=1168546 RepID=A0A9P4JA86_9PEZI|nr:hypothetical protein K461DRAFT_310114 [Myriangium duriaei CBS 260.36]
MAGIPYHPATVHWPIAFLTLAYALDFLAPLHSSLPANIQLYLPPPVELARISYYALSLGLLTSLPAILTGAANATKAVERQGLYDERGAIRGKFKSVAVHAVLNDLVIAGSAWVWFGRLREDGVVKDWGRAGTAVALGVVLLFAAHLGGKLVYVQGMGVGGAGKVALGKKAN